MGLCSGAEREFAYPANGPTTKWSEYGWVVVSTGSHNSVHGRMSADGMVRPCSRPSSARSLRRGSEDKGATPMSENLNSAIAVIGIDIGKNSFHLVGQDRRGSIVLRQKWSRGQVEARLANLQPCLIGMEACVGAHHLSRKLQALGHDARLMPAKYVRPYSKAGS